MTTTMKTPARRFALLAGILPVDPRRVPLDIVAGILLAALATPEVMGYSAYAVWGPKHVVKTGRTPVLGAEETRILPDCIVVQLSTPRTGTPDKKTGRVSEMCAGHK